MVKEHGCSQGPSQKLNLGCAPLEVPARKAGGGDGEAASGQVLYLGRKTKMEMGIGMMTLKINKGRGEKRFEEMTHVFSI